MASIKDEIKRLNKEITSLKKEVISLYFLIYFDEDFESSSSDIERFINDLEALKASKSKNE